MLSKLKLKTQRFLYSLFCVPFVLGMTAIPAYASSGSDSASLTDTLDIFSEVFAWFMQEGGNLLSWMLDKPIILLSLSIFFVGAVVGMLSRIYSSF